MEDIGELKLVGTDLCLIDKDINVTTKIHKPTSAILEFRRIKKNIIVLRLDTEDERLRGRSNIYCLDDNLEAVWYAELPSDGDRYTNQIVWDKELDDKGLSWDDYVKDNCNSLTTSSQNGMTVTIDYDTGTIINKQFTK